MSRIHRIASVTTVFLASLLSPNLSHAEELNGSVAGGAGSRSESPAKSQAETPTDSTERSDPMRAMQNHAYTSLFADWGYWGSSPDRYSTWMNHSNRLIPIYTFGITLDVLREEGSVYTDESRLTKLYGALPADTCVAEADYFDQTDVYRLQQQAIAAGKKRVILVVFDGMDWDSTYNAALYKNGKVTYTEGRGNGLTVQDYRGAETDFGYFVTSPRLSACRIDVNAQTVLGGSKPSTGGYDPRRGGGTPWQPAPQPDYLMGLDRTAPHSVTDSASSATSMTAGIKTYNAAINVDVFGNQVETIAHALQRDQQFAIGVVTSVPICHATPAGSYSHNVSRDDYQDLTRDLIGLPSVAHKTDPLPGVDVLIGGGWGEAKQKDEGQGDNFVPGRQHFDVDDLMRVSVENGGKYVVAQRTRGQAGGDVIKQATTAAIAGGHRLLGVFGVAGGHLPFATADGNFDPVPDGKINSTYSSQDVSENPTLADMATAALQVLDTNANGFWLMVEAGDVDWANHANNIDNSIGAVLSGDRAVKAIFDWIEANDAWSDTAVIVTADHGHYFKLKNPQAIADAGKQ